MRCVLRAMKRLARRALPTVLMLAVAPTAVLAQSLVCQAIRRGDTASHVAQRLTGNGRNKYQPWFQILTPSGSFVPKSQYDRLRPGWRACVIRRALDTSARKANMTAAAESSAAPMQSNPQDLESSAAAEASEATRSSRSSQRGPRRTRGACDRRRLWRPHRSHGGMAWRGGRRAVVRVADPRRLSRSQEESVARACGTLPIDSSTSSNDR